MRHEFGNFSHAPIFVLFFLVLILLILGGRLVEFWHFKLLFYKYEQTNLVTEFNYSMAF